MSLRMDPTKKLYVFLDGSFLVFARSEVRRACESDYDFDPNVRIEFFDDGVEDFVIKSSDPATEVKRFMEFLYNEVDDTTVLTVPEEMPSYCERQRRCKRAERERQHELKLATAAAEVHTKFWRQTVGQLVLGAIVVWGLTILWAEGSGWRGR